MISFLNPKILAFFVEIFSQFIHDELTRFERIIIATIAGVIDTTWYVLVAILLAGTKLIDKITQLFYAFFTGNLIFLSGC